jgi:CRP/FNR family transcriptional regulator
MMVNEIDVLAIDSLEYIEMDYSPGEVIFKQGTIAPHIVFLKSGLVKIYLEHHNRKQPLCIEKTGFVGLESMYNDKFFQYSLSSLTDTSVYLIEMESFKKAIMSNPDLAVQVIENINTRSMYLYERIITLTQKQAPGRVADIILCLSDRIFDNDQFTLPCPRKDFAEMATISVESLSRILKDFKEEDIVDIDGKKVKITDKKKLEMISNVS